MMSPHGVGAWQQWRSQSFAITGADGGRGHVLLQVNFDPGFETRGSYLLLKFTKLKIVDKRHWQLYST